MAGANAMAVPKHVVAVEVGKMTAIIRTPAKVGEIPVTITVQAMIRRTREIRTKMAISPGQTVRIQITGFMKQAAAM